MIKLQECAIINKEVYITDVVDITVDVATTDVIKFYITGVAATTMMWKAMLYTISQN